MSFKNTLAQKAIRRQARAEKDERNNRKQEMQKRAAEIFEAYIDASLGTNDEPKPCVPVTCEPQDGEESTHVADTED